ncbi:acyltransferase family protein [Xylophilus sp. GOD-11R]|uniref:acyltransferase family protein n=1 Tax=Xylophilus sp. GOD-11R TaxID=3089814 RepID=UPI00298D5920|nr:acyltransferase family protein [Xylophilus sp. GOD-11R]WPB57832.1 acyltransferase family protein [Xylophilus sp. GOD-11R]
MMTTPQGRNVVIDIARGIAMLLVMYAHSIEVFQGPQAPAALATFDQWRAIYSFHMPLFFAISGLVFRDRGLRHVLLNSLALLFVAYLVHAGMWLAAALLSDGPVHAGALLRPMLLLAGFQSVVLWFLASLAVVQLVFFLLLRWSGYGRYALLAAVLAAFLWAQHRQTIFFQFSTLLPGLAFFALGHWMARTQAWRREIYRHWIVPVLALAAAVALAPLNGGCTWDLWAECPNRRFGFGVLFAAGQYGSPWLFVPTALLGCFSVLWFSDVLARMPGGFKVMLAAVGRRTLDLVVINGVVWRFVHPVVTRKFGDSAWAVAVGIACAMVVAQLLLEPLVRPAMMAIRRAAEMLAAWICRCLIWLHGSLAIGWRR